MTIGMNELIKKLNGGVDLDKLSKNEFTSQDFSSISKQFSSIFNNQFDSKFQEQFDYKQMFSNGSNKSDFMSNTVSKVSDDKYFTPSFNITANEQPKAYEPSKANVEHNTTRAEVKSQEPVQSATVAQSQQQPQQVQNTPEKNAPKAEEKHSNKENASANSENKKAETGSEKNKETKKDLEEAEVVAQALAMIANVHKVQIKEVKEVSKDEKAIKLSVTKNVEEEAKVKDSSLLVSVKATELENTAKLVSAEALPKINVDLKDVKIEKLDVKVKAKQETKEKDKVKAEVETEKKTEVNPKENIQNKVAMERATANVTENVEPETALDKLMNKDLTKKPDSSAKVISMENDKADNRIHSELRNANAFGNNQNFGQNFGQSNQESQAHMKTNVLAANIASLNTAIHKANTQQINTFAQHAQANSQIERQVFDQVMKNIQGNISAEKSEVTMILKPEHLGKVTLNIMNDRGTVSAEFKAETREAAEALNKNIQDLKETLKQQGVVCANLVVKLEEPARSEQNMHFAQEQNQNPKDFAQGNPQNSGQDSFEHESNDQTAKNEINQDIQVEQEQSNQVADDPGVVDYRV